MNLQGDSNDFWQFLVVTLHLHSDFVYYTTDKIKITFCDAIVAM